MTTAADFIPRCFRPPPPLSVAPWCLEWRWSSAKFCCVATQREGGRGSLYREGAAKGDYLGSGRVTLHPHVSNRPWQLLTRPFSPQNPPEAPLLPHTHPHARKNRKRLEWVYCYRRNRRKEGRSKEKRRARADTGMRRKKKGFNI